MILEDALLDDEQRPIPATDGPRTSRRRAWARTGLSLLAALALLFVLSGALWRHGAASAETSDSASVVTERFELTVQRPVGAESVAHGLAALLGLQLSRISVEQADASAQHARLAISVAHPRASAVCALSVLGSIPRATLDAAINATVLAGLPFCLSLLHVNDQHARMDPVNADLNPWGSRDDIASNATKYGGAAIVWGALHARRAALEAAGRHALVLNVGDEFTGTAWFTYYGSEVTARVLRAAGLVDAMVLGNHEFDHGAHGLARFLEQLGGEVRVRSHNIDVSRVPQLARHADAFYPRGYHIITRRHEGRAVRIAVVGVTTASTPESSSPGPDVIFREPIAALRALVPRLRAEHAVEHVIVLSHCGVLKDEQIAAGVPGISAVVGGHSHTLIRYAHNVSTDGGAPRLGASPASVPVVQARAYSRYIGELELCWPPQKRTAHGAADGPEPTAVVGAEPAPSVVAALEVIDLPEGTFAPHPAVARVLAEMAPAIDRFKRTVVGYADADMRNTGCFTADCAAGLLLSAAYLASDFAVEHGAQIALNNAGGVRASFERGNVTEAEVLTVVPFQNQLVACALPGASVLAALEYSFAALQYDPASGSLRPDGPEGAPGAFPQLAGVRVTFDPRRPPGERVLSATLARTAEPIEPSGTYTLVTNSYLMRGGDGYDDLKEGCAHPIEDGPIDASVVSDYWRASSPVDPSRDLPNATHMDLTAEWPQRTPPSSRQHGSPTLAAWEERLQMCSAAPAGGTEGARYAPRAAREAHAAQLVADGAAQPCVIGARRGASTWAFCGADPGHVLGA